MPRPGRSGGTTGGFSQFVVVKDLRPTQVVVDEKFQWLRDRIDLLPPTEAMRPEPPGDFKPSALERLGLQKLVSPAFRTALRNLERKPWQAFFTAFGLALATAIPIVPGAMRDGVTYLMSI